MEICLLLTKKNTSAWKKFKRQNLKFGRKQISGKFSSKKKQSQQNVCEWKTWPRELEKNQWKQYETRIISKKYQVSKIV